MKMSLQQLSILHPFLLSNDPSILNHEFPGNKKEKEKLKIPRIEFKRKHLSSTVIFLFSLRDFIMSDEFPINHYLIIINQSK